MKRVFSFLLLAVFLSLTGTATVQAIPQQQGIVIEAKNEPLASVLAKLEKATGYKVQYVNSDVYGVKVNQTVNTRT